MNYKKEVEAIAAQLGATVERTSSPDGVKTIEAVAPEGSRWDEGPGVLVANYGKVWGCKADDAWKDLWERMAEGLLDATT